MNIKVRIALLSALIFTFVIGCAISNQPPKSGSNVAIQSSIIATLQSTLNPDEIATLSNERTAIAIFTQNPALALSSTPFYAEIIFNEVIRNLTEVPLPNRNCFLAATDVPLNPATSIGTCNPIIATIVLNETAFKLIDLLKQASIQGTVGVDSTGLQGLDKSDSIPFVAIQSRLGFRLEVTTVNDQTLVSDIILRITKILNENWSSLEYVSLNAQISMQFDGDDSSKYISTTYDTLKRVYETGLKGEAVIQAVGGLKDTPEQLTS